MFCKEPNYVELNQLKNVGIKEKNSKLLKIILLGLQSSSGLLSFLPLCSTFSLITENYFYNKQCF